MSRRIIGPGIAMIFGGRLRGSWMSCTRWSRSCASMRRRRRLMICRRRCFMCSRDLIEADVDEIDGARVDRSDARAKARAVVG